MSRRMIKKGKGKQEVIARFIWLGAFQVSYLQLESSIDTWY
jgi:hypothetical protein